MTYIETCLALGDEPGCAVRCPRQAAAAAPLSPRTPPAPVLHGREKLVISERLGLPRHG